MVRKMNYIEQLKDIDFLGWVITLFLIISIIIAGYEIICKFSAIIGKPIGIMKQRKEDHELLAKTVQGLNELRNTHETDKEQSIRHDEMLREDIKQLMEKVDNVTVRFENMEKKNNETKLKELKDTLINYYNKYRVVGEWTKLEKEAFWDLFDDYEKRGGNGYVHSIVEPVMRELKEID